MTNIRLVTTKPVTELVGTEAVRLALAERGINVSRSTVDRLVRDDVLRPYRKLPGRNGAYLFRNADVERVAKAMAREAA